MDITKVTSKRFLVPGLLLLILIFLATFPLYGGAYNVRVLTTILMYVVLAVSWAMFSGPTGYMSLAPAAFLGVGIYLSAVMYSQSEALLPLPVVIVIGGLASFIIALLIGIVTLRLKGIYFAIFTFGLVVLLSELVLWVEININEISGRYPRFVSIETVFYVTLGILVATLLTAYFIRRSRLGLALQSIGGNEEAAAHMGVNTTMVKVITFAISAFFMGAVGAISAPRLIYVHAHIAFDVVNSFLPVVMAVFGGLGQFYGPIIGAVVLAFAEVRLKPHFPYFYMLAFGIILIIIIFFLPTGLVGLIPTLQDKLWGPVPALRKEKTWKVTAAGILNIIGGIFQVIVSIILFMGSGFLAQFAGLEFIGGFIGWLAGLYTVVAIVLIILGLTAILGGICALRRSSWRLGLAGSICALLSPAFILGIPAIILIILGKDEFEYVVEGGRTEQHANT